MTKPKSERAKVVERKLPLSKRYPGEHIIRCKLWTPDGSWLLWEGPISLVAAGEVMTAIVNSKRDKPAALKPRKATK